VKKAALIANPLSGRCSKKAIQRFLERLEKMGFSVHLWELAEEQKIEEVIALLEPGSLDLLVLMAGDGTINSALNALAARDDHEKFKLAIAPAGTANILSKELDTDSLGKSLKAIEYGKIKRVHLGKIRYLVENREKTGYFALMISAGFDSLAVNGVNMKLKKIVGGLAYIYELFKILVGRDLVHLETEVDGLVYKNVLTCVSNGRYYGVKIPTTESRLEDNSFDVVIIKKISILSVILHLFRKKSDRNIIKLTGKNNVSITTIAKDYPLQIDGDYYCNLPARVESSGIYINMYYL
jgi:diacylglycerol kinase (ATP)